MSPEKAKNANDTKKIKYCTCEHVKTIDNFKENTEKNYKSKKKFGEKAKSTKEKGTRKCKK